MYKKRNSFFRHKKCKYCGRPGTVFKVIKGKHEVICGGFLCDRRAMANVGYYGINITFKSRG